MDRRTSRGLRAIALLGGIAIVVAVAAHDHGATEVMIANPLAEWDLVGVRLIGLMSLPASK